MLWEGPSSNTLAGEFAPVQTHCVAAEGRMHRLLVWSFPSKE